MKTRIVIKLLIIIFLIIILLHLFNKIQEGATRNVKQTVSKATITEKAKEKLKEAPKNTKPAKPVATKAVTVTAKPVATKPVKKK
jgi:uncharacterized protein YxeA